MTAPILPRRPGELIPLSYGQELFWLLDRATPGLTAYNVPRAYRIRGALDTAALFRALDQLLVRHEILRTVYRTEGETPVQVVLPTNRVAFEMYDLRPLNPEYRSAEADRLLKARARHHFDLGKEIPFQGALLQLEDDHHILFLLTHHIASDGWSKTVLHRELSALYAAAHTKQPSPLAPLPIQFGDYALWERRTIAGPELERRLAFWRNRLSGPLPTLTLPTDRPRPSGHTFDGSYREAFLPPDLVQRMRALGQAHGASLYMVLLAAYQTLLHRYSGQDDIVVGSPTAGRGAEETHDLMGYFANALVLRTSLAGDPSFGALLERVSEGCLDAYEHQDLPFETLVLELQKGAQLTHAPLFQCVLTMEDTHPAALQLGSTVIEPVDAEVAGTKFDLTLLVSEQPEGLRMRLGYRTDLFNADRIIRMLGHLRTLLEHAVEAPDTAVSALRLLPEEERETLETWNATAWDEGPAATIPELVDAAGARDPSVLAVVGQDARLTWSELLGQANRIAHWLRAHGVAPGDAVGLCLDRSAAMITGLLGILKAGGAYVPLVPDLPAARLAQQLQDTGARVAVTATPFLGLLPESMTRLDLTGDAAVLATLPDTTPPRATTPDALAYVLFTSGSTGTPKGVAVTHANLVHYTRAISRVMGFSLVAKRRPQHWATVSTLGADLGHTAVFPALCTGGTLHVLPGGVSTDAVRFAEYVRAQPLDVLKITPNHLRALMAGAQADLLPKQWLVLGGEACPADFADELMHASPGRILNHYGPTETTVGACTHEVLAGSTRASPTVPIGRPLPNTRVYVLDPRGEQCPIGVAGELYIGGAGVTRGYVGRDDLTAERFVPDRFSPAPGGRLYRTGDRVRWLSHGELEFLGRLDDQVKIRGYRVEPGEVEAILGGHSQIRQVAVLAEPGSDGSLRLVAYLAGDAVPDDATLARWVGQRVPEYMVPAAWHRSDALPLNPNGKIDRRALPALASARAEPAAGAAPTTETERTLLALFAEILKRPEIGVHDDFFAMGGHSLLAIRLLGRVSKAFGKRLTLRALFDAPTVAQLAEALDPETPLEAQLAGIWREVLKRDQIGRDESFFDLGGHSLLAIRVLGRISKVAGVRLPLRALFDAPTVRQLAQVLSARRDNGHRNGDP